MVSDYYFISIFICFLVVGRVISLSENIISTDLSKSTKDVYDYCFKLFFSFFFVINKTHQDRTKSMNIYKIENSRYHVASRCNS